MSLLVTVPTDRLADDLRPLPDGVEVEVWDMRTPPPAQRIDIVVPPYLGDPEPLKVLDGLQIGLVQWQSIGFDGVEEALPAGIPFANASGVHEASTAELAVGLIIAAQRGLPAYVEAQAAGRWAPVFTESLADRRVLLVGFGGVGEAIALRLEPFEIDMSVVARTARPVWHERLGRVQVHAIEELASMLPDAEIVVISLPGGQETRHLFDADMLSQLRDGALLVNVGRGSIIDSAALEAELRSGRIRAALDVFEQEPIPADASLWSAPNLLTSPHVGGASSAMHPRIARLVRTQIDRMLAGVQPTNIVLGA